MKKIAIIVTMLLTISTFAQVNPSQPTKIQKMLLIKEIIRLFFVFF